MNVRLALALAAIALLLLMLAEAGLIPKLAEQFRQHSP
jgi:hypothetical protein